MCKKQVIIIILYCFALLGLLSCSEKNKTESDQALTSNNKAYQEIKKSRVKFNFNQSFEIKEIKRGASLSDIHVTGIGFPNSSAALKFENQYPIEAYLIGDLDFNGFEEMYIITRSGGSGSYGRVIAITSFNGKSYKSIYIPEYDTEMSLNFEYLKEYMGHDRFYVENKKLCREFPIYNFNDINAIPTGGKRKLEYKLIEYNGGFTLQVDSYKDFN